VPEPPKAQCLITPNSGTIPFNATLSDLSSGSYETAKNQWSCGNGQTPNGLVCTYATAGTFIPTLTISGNGASSTANCGTVTAISPTVIADFTADKVYAATPPLTVAFSDKSQGGPFTTWQWDFGDKTGDTVQNPTHTYSTAGNYTVTLTVKGLNGADSETKIFYITIDKDPPPPPKIDFTATPTNGLATLAVTFSATNTGGSVQTWLWNFGDGATSPLQNPVHQYAEGSYTVTLTASNVSGTDTKTKVAYIVVSPPPALCDFTATPSSGTAPLTVTFTATGAKCQASRYMWDYGDDTFGKGITSTHVYTTGTYTATLIAVGTNLNETIVKVITVNPPSLVCQAAFTAPADAWAMDAVPFTNTSNNCTSYQWNFGDGTTSQAQNPSHVYKSPGQYTITLTADNSSTASQVITIWDNAIGLQADFIAKPTSGFAPLKVQFTSLVTGPVKNWQWSFGNTEPHPIYTYTTAGIYTVTLTVNGLGKTATVTKAAYITAISTDTPLILTINPAHPKDADNLTLTIEPALDSYQIWWTRNGILQPAYQNQTLIPATATFNQDDWCATVQPKQFAEFPNSLSYSTCVHIGNTPPVATNVTLLPALPKDSDSLMLKNDYVDADNDQECPAAKKILWQRNGLPQTAFANQEAIPSSATIPGEVWCGFVQVNDCQNDSLPAMACQVINPNDNNLPRIITATIQPDAPTEGTALTLRYEFNDPDNDHEGATEIRWYLNDVHQPAYFGQTAIPASATVGGDTWYATIVPHDGHAPGPAYQTAPVQIIPLNNLPPVVKEVYLSPNKPGDDANLQLHFTCEDPNPTDIPTAKIYWYKNLVRQTAWDTQTVVLANATTLGDNWYAVVICSDGKLESEPGIAHSVLIRQVTGNTLPVALNVFLAPANPGDNQSLELHYTYTDDDRDPQGATVITWTTNGTAQPIFENQTAVPDSATSMGEVWCALVTPHDGHEYGQKVKSNCVTIGEARNTPPVVLKPILINPILKSNRLRAQDPLDFTYVYFDPDGDLEGKSEIRWYKNGQPQTAFDNLLTLPKGATSPGEVWTTTVKPHDGRDFGLITTSQIVTVNTPPKLAKADLIPTAPLDSQSLGLRYSGYQDADNDPPCSPQIRWYKDGILQTAYNDKEILPASATNVGEKWHATIAPNDCLEYGMPLTTQPTEPVIPFTVKATIYLPVLMKDYTPPQVGPYENNNWADYAYGPLEFTRVYTANPEDTEDWYYVVLTQTASFSVKVTDYQVKGQLAIYDSGLNLLSADGVHNQSMEVPNWYDFYVLYNLKPGTYYLRIHTYPFENNTSNKPYRLIVTFAP